MLKFLGLIFVNVILFSCSHVSKNTTKDKPQKVTSSKQSSRVQKHIVEKDLKACEGCILGSSHEGTFSSPLRVYQLRQNDIDLKNTTFDIPVVWNSEVKKWVKYFTGKGRSHFARYTGRAGRYAPVLSKILAEQGLPRDLIYLAMAESGFQNHAKSWASAVGPWQFMSFTGRKYGLDIDWYQDERRDPFKASVAAAGYLRDLYDLFGSWELATAGYNAGEGKIGRAIQRYGTRDFWKLAKGRYLKPETKNYVPKIMALAIIGKNLESFGLTEEIEFDHALDFDEIKLPPRSDLYEVANVLETDFEEIKRFNPELIRWETPASEEYNLRVPVGLGAKWNNLEDKSVVVSQKYQIFSTPKTMTLSEVANKYRLPLNVLQILNPENDQVVKAGTEVKLPFRADHAPYHEMYADLNQKSRKGRRGQRSYYRSIASQRESSGKQFYVVKKGDNLYTIAKRNGTTVSRLLKQNSHLSKRRQITPGQKLAIR